MREIKFRVWNKTLGRFDPAGLPIIHNSEKGIFGVDNSYVEHFVVQQYTGLKDKNGVEIYEGDILKIEFRDIDNSTHMIKSEVVYHDNGFYENWGGKLKVLVGSTTHEYNGKKFTIGSSEVVGNIFEGVK